MHRQSSMLFVLLLTQTACGRGGFGVPSAAETTHCVADADCMGLAPRCNPSTQTCVACLSNLDCGDSAPLCDTATHTCVECFTDETCSSTTPWCNTTTHTCVACLSDDVCGGTTPWCDSALHSCVECRTAGDCDDTHECTTDICLAGVCSNNAAADATACGDPTATECDNPDTCLNGTCVPNFKGPGAACGDQGIDCKQDDGCDGAGTCVDAGFIADTTACGDPTDTECDNPDTCLAGACAHNYETAGIACGDQGVECYADDSCNGAGVCTDNGSLPDHSPCGGGFCMAATCVSLQSFKIAKSGWTSCLLDDTGAVLCWGDDMFGLGCTDGECLVPTPVPGMEDITEITMGESNLCGIFGDGTVHCLGANGCAQVTGTGVTSAFEPTPIEVFGIAGAVQVSGGNCFACALLDTGKVVCWGDNVDGQASGDGTTGGNRATSEIPGLSNIVQVSAGDLHTCVVRADGHAFCWGHNGGGKIGDGVPQWNMPGYDGTQTVINPVTTPTEVVTLTDVASITASNCGTCAVRRTGEVACWGENSEGELGVGGTWDSSNPYYYGTSTPVSVVGITDAIAIATGYLHFCALLQSGGVKCWGWNGNGQLGVDASIDGLWESNLPVDVTNVTHAVELSLGVANSDHYCVLLASGEVQCWGDCYSGQCGDGTSGSNRPVPVTVLGL